MNPKDKEKEIIKELESHLHDKEKELLLQGYTQEQAKKMALEQFGNFDKCVDEIHKIHKHSLISEHFFLFLFYWFITSIISGLVTVLKSPADLNMGDASTLHYILVPPLVGLFFGIFSFFTPFSLLFIFVEAILILAYFKLKFLKNERYLFIVSLGTILNWLTLFLSYRNLSFTFFDRPIATAGFPLKVFDYPVPPMGSDLPPLSMWPEFYLNFLILLGFSVLISFLIPKKLYVRVITRHLIAASIALTAFGLGYLFLKFD